MKDQQAHLLAIASVIVCSIVVFAFLGASKDEFVTFAEAKETISTFAGVGLYNSLELLADEKRMEVEAEIKKTLRIYLPDNIEESDIEFSADYVNRKLSIVISNADEEYLESQPIVGSCNHIADVNWWTESGKVYIDLQLDGVYEYNAVCEGNQLKVSFVKPKELYDKVIVVDAGHGGSHPGTNRNDILEKDITLDIVLYLKELLDKSNIRVYYTREDDTNPSFDNRVQLANEIDADFFVSVHINADEKSRESSGTEALYYTQDERSREFAQICAEQVSKSLNSKNRGVTNGDSIYIIRNAKVPVALIEVGFISNNAEFNLLCSEAYKKKAAEGIYNAILQAYENKN